MIHMAYDGNPNLRVVGARVLEARAGQAISVGNFLPQSQQAIGSYTRANVNPNMPVINQLVKIAAARVPFRSPSRTGSTASI